MFQSKIPNFIRKEAPRDEEAVNAKLLIRSGFIDKLSSGVYSYLPFGNIVLRKIENIVREEMNAIGAGEILMPVIHPKENWMKTKRWENLDVLFKVKGRDKKEYALGPTHEEIISPLSQKAIYSYKDLPFGVFQIQTKLRDEPRAKSGILRGREFLMKDLYSFHTDQRDLDVYYERIISAYKKIYKRLGLSAVVVEASGGSFSKFSHEFQVFLESGEDTIVYCKNCKYAQNKEINNTKDGGPCPKCGHKIELKNGVEVGNTFKLGTKYSEPFNLSFKDSNGSEKLVYMGCYGIGISRIMGVLAELNYDEKGLKWPKQVSPFDVHLIALQNTSASETRKIYLNAKKIYEELSSVGISVLYDDREISAGQKFAESDLIGIPIRLVVSSNTGTKIEFKKREDKKTKLVDIAFVKKYFK